MTKTKPNILFIILDSMRSDKFHTASTPNINSLINQGTYFSQNFCSSDYTISGYGTIFSSLYPINAGISGMDYHKIFSKVPNYITQLKNFGYHVYSLVDTWSIKLGLENFENDDKEYDRTTLNLFNGLGDRIIDKLESNSLEEPWFYFIHLEDLHIPVFVPKKFQDKKYSERYDLVVSEIDSWLGKIIEKIELENTLVVITADHGDYILSVDDGLKDSFSSKIKSKIKKHVPNNLYDQASVKKRTLERSANYLKAKSSLEKRRIDTRTGRERYLYDDLIHVPLLFLGYNIPSSKKDNLVRSIDIFPTIANLIGMENYPQIDGRSLIPLINGEKMNEESVYLENTIFETTTKSPKPCIGMRTSKYKYFRRLELEDDQKFLFDLVNDPLEENNIIEMESALAKKFELQLSEIRKSLLDKFESPELNDEETKDVENELKKLGYI